MIILVKIAARGDLLLAAPAFRQLRREHPEERIVLVVGRSCRDVAERLPYFDEIRTVDDAALFGRSLRERLRGAAELWRALRRLCGRASASATVMILHRDWRYAAIAWLARVGERRGFASGYSRFFLSYAHDPDPREHHTVQYLRVVGADPSAAVVREPLWQFLPGERDAALARAQELGFGESRRPLVALGFGGGHNVRMSVDLKRWPLESFERLAAQLTDDGCDVVWLGDDADARRLGSSVPGVVLAGGLTVAQSAAVVSRCDLVIANDTMLLHMAGALGVRALGIFGPTDPAQTRPLQTSSDHVWLGPAELPCAPCHRDGFYPPCLHEHRCMRSLSVESVLGRARTLLGGSLQPVSVGAACG